MEGECPVELQYQKGNAPQFDSHPSLLPIPASWDPSSALLRTKERLVIDACAYLLNGRVAIDPLTRKGSAVAQN
eukprot:6210222-Amphidinium_carterae.1